MAVAISFPGVKIMDFDVARYAPGVPGQPGLHHRDDLADGAAEWLREAPDRRPWGLMYVCPCGCKVVGEVTVKPEAAGVSWYWDLDLERPTLKPSIARLFGCHWHGFLTAGVWETC